MGSYLDSGVLYTKLYESFPVNPPAINTSGTVTASKNVSNSVI